ncbi:AMP-binding protein [Psychromonas sp. GE-S-Ul-11]|uniref:AMP-binding protein n=1 Tax=Psychromonas sp. GE-S-Ul-11 TaxID=3241170 RepID=UPI00390C813B
MVTLIDQCPVRYHAINQGQQIAIQDDQQPLTYQQLDNQLTLLAEQLEQQTTLVSYQTKTDKSEANRLICIASNGLQLLLLQLLCLRTGWLFCPLNPRFTDTEIQQRLTVLNSPYCWVEDDSCHEGLKTITINFAFSPLPSKQSTALSIDSLQPCNIIFTSGSSGFPKAIVHHYQNHFFSALGSQSLIPLQNKDHNLLSLPLFHVSGYATVIRTIIAGATLELSHQPLSYDLIYDRKITHLSLVSTQLIRLLKDARFSPQKTKIKHLLLGGSAFSETLLSALAIRSFTYHLSYGCTEMASQVATSNKNNQLTILPYRQVKIENNEIFLRGKTRFIGYFEENKLLTIPPQKWLSCGDCGQLQGNQLIISGRKDRQFISGGENIQPEEIEILCLQHNNVENAYIYPIQDPQYGQRLALFVAFTEIDSTYFRQYCKQLEHYLSQQLTSFKLPLHYLPWPTLKGANTLKVTQQHFKDSLLKRGLIA